MRLTFSVTRTVRRRFRFTTATLEMDAGAVAATGVPKSARTSVRPLIVTTHGPRPLQPIIQPLNVNDEFCGVAVTVTSVPSGKCAPRFVGQFAPGGSLVMIPWPVSVCTTSTSPTENQPVMKAWFSHWYR